MERIDGVSMLDDLVSHPWRLRAHAATLAELHDRLHQLEAPDGLLEPFGPGRALVHGDLHPGNVMLTPDGPLVIDWTNAAKGPPGADLAVMWLLTAAAEAPGSAWERGRAGRVPAGVPADVPGPGRPGRRGRRRSPPCSPAASRTRTCRRPSWRPWPRSWRSTGPDPTVGPTRRAGGGAGRRRARLLRCPRCSSTSDRCASRASSACSTSGRSSRASAAGSPWWRRRSRCTS